MNGLKFLFLVAIFSCSNDRQKTGNEEEKIIANQNSEVEIPAIWKSGAVFQNSTLAYFVPENINSTDSIQ